MARVDLPSGGWVELRDASTVRVRDRKQVMLAADKTGVAGLMSSGDMVIALAVTAWSFDDRLPIEQPDVLDDLEIPDYDAIADALGDFHAALFPDFKAAGPKATSPA